MQQVKKPKKPLIFYYCVVLLVMVLLNTIVVPSLLKTQIKEVDYGTFLTMLNDKEVDTAQVEDDVIYFTDKAEKQQAYSTVVFNDPDLVDRLYNSGCKFGKIQDEKDSWVSQFILFVLQIAVFVAIGQMLSRMLMKKMGGGGLGNAMQFGKSNAKVYVASETGIKFHDVAGEDEAKEQLQEIVDFLHNPGKYQAIGATMPKGALLVGPPGTGKTSVARSIAEALNKKYVRICLGGVHDEAEIRGHRRTYIGAMPGRIVDGIRQAGVKNPLMVLDEIDKVSADYKGDTFSALLEVLDSEQNSKFRDHYVEIPMDLSEVMFICTANDLSTVPRPLLDRMEIIEVSGYTENEKYHIATEHLMQKQMKKHGLDESRFQISEKAMQKIIHEYTRESGVRALERRIASLCRKADREILEKNRKKVQITERNLEKYLGKSIYETNMKAEHDEVGIVRGLAWTSVGGDTLEIEVNLMPGKGKFELTGQLGDVMQESAKAGISYIRSVSDDYELDPEYFQQHDIHIHIPEGAVPKDGPSAGITMATAMLSAVLNKPVRADVAMTGEITLRGRVLPIGGLKEKLLAAKGAGMKTVIVPEKNRRDVEELSREITGGLELVYAQNMNDVISHAFVQ